MAVTIKKDFNRHPNRKDYGNERHRRPDLTSLVYGKIPPQANELEEAVLGAIMLEKDKLNEVISIISAEECFYVDAHQKIYAAIRRLYEQGSPVDLLTVTEALRKSNELEIVGGAYYLTRLTMSVISSAHVEAHARIVVEKYMQREVIRVAGELIADAYEDSTDVFDLLDKAEAGIFGISASTVRKDYQTAAQLAHESEQDFLHRQQYQEEVIGITSGWRALDNLTLGWQAPQVIIVAARPSVGKTAFAINLMLNAAVHIERDGNKIRSWRKGKGVGFFSLEMGAKKITARCEAAIGHIDIKRLMKGNLSEWEQQARYEAQEIFSQLNIFIDEQPALNLFELRSKARRMVARGAEMIIIDYLQLMQGNSTSGNREQEISSISRGIKALAKELAVPIIPLSQLNREADKRNGGIPILADLRESGAIEQDADLVMFLTRPDYQQGETMGDPALKGYMDVHVAKNREGEIDTVPLHFLKHYQKVMDTMQYDAWKGMAFDTQVQQVPFDNPRAGMPVSKLYIQGGVDDKPFG